MSTILVAVGWAAGRRWLDRVRAHAKGREISRLAGPIGHR